MCWGRDRLERHRGDLVLDDADDAGLCKGGEIAKLVALASDDLAHDAAHDLAGARLGQVRDDVDLLGRREGADDLAHLEDELLDEAGLVGGVVAELTAGGLRSERMLRENLEEYVRLEGDEGVDSLARELVVGTDDGGLSDTRVEDEGRLDLGSRETVTRDVDDICGRP